MALRDDLKTWIPKLIFEVSSKTEGYVVTPDDWNAMWNLNREQGDWNSDTIKDILTMLYQTVLDDVNGAQHIKFASAGFTATNVLTAIQELYSDDAALATLISNLTTALANHKTSGDHDGRYYTETEVSALLAAKAAANAVVDLTTNQTIGGSKSFVDPVEVPNPVTGNHAINRTFLESQLYGIIVGQLSNGSVTYPKLVVGIEDSFNASKLLDRIKTVDGAGSGLDTDLFDGLNSTEYLKTGATRTTGAITDIPINTVCVASPTVVGIPVAEWCLVVHTGVDATSSILEVLSLNTSAHYTLRKLSGAWGSWVKHWNSLNDGSGSGLDADLLDGAHGSQYVRSDQRAIILSQAGQSIDAPGSIATGFELQQPGPTGDAVMSFHNSGRFACHFGLDMNTNDMAVGGWSFGAVKHKMFHAGNYGKVGYVTAPFTLALGHENGFIYCDGSGTITVPTNAACPFPIGTQILVIGGANTFTFVPNAGVTIYSKDSKRTLDGTYAAATLIKNTANAWFLVGALKV